MIYLIFRRLNI